MSVVNRMLLDIDQRHGAAAIKAQGPYPDIRSVPPRVVAPGRMPIVAMLAAAGVLAFAAWAAHRAGWFERAPLPVVRPLAIATAPAPSAPPTPLAAAPTSVAISPAAAIVATGEPASAPAPSRPARARAPGPGVEPFRLSRELSNLDERLAAAPKVAVAAPPRAAVAPTAVAPKTNPPLRQVGGEETVAVARALWNGGARADALATLRETLAVAEGARNMTAVAPIARELARLEVADNRPQAALELLRRLEGALAEDAEAWALRGNAEQRLALHADSSRSYLAALRMRPAESRWMLGAAISLAAEGKVEEAQAWAERARERGAMTPAIEGYLQQLGVGPRR